jgi:hypothetical protein
MSTAKKNQLKRDHALNDATGGQFREEPSSLPQSDTLDIENGSCKKAARELSRNIDKLSSIVRALKQKQGISDRILSAKYHP